MPYRKISRDVKIAAIRLWELHQLTLEQILACCRISESTFYRILRLWRETGDVVSHRLPHQGRLRLLERADVDYLVELIRQNPDYFLDELLVMLDTNRFISVHFVTIYRELRRAGLSRKKLRKIAKERNEPRRAAFIARMAQYRPEEIGFIDEVSKDERTTARRYGWSRSGTRSEKSLPFVRGRRTTTEALLSLDGIVARTVVEGSMTKAMFLAWLEDVVVCTHLLSFSISKALMLPGLLQLPKCHAYPGPLSVLVMDNAKIHHGAEFLELFDRFGMSMFIEGRQ